jgi:hypothetical protein
MESERDLAEVLEFFGAREIGVEFIRNGEPVRLRAPAGKLKRYTFRPSIR